MTNQDELEDFVVSFIADYTLGGRGKNELISFLKAYPLASAYLVNEIIEHLENPERLYLDKKTNVGKELEHEAIYQAFTYGPNYFPSFAPNGSLEIDEEWAEQSYDEKLYQIHKIFPKYTRDTIGKIISLHKKQ